MLLSFELSMLASYYFVHFHVFHTEISHPYGMLVYIKSLGAGTMVILKIEIQASFG